MKREEEEGVEDEGEEPYNEENAEQVGSIRIQSSDLQFPKFLNGISAELHSCPAPHRA